MDINSFLDTENSHFGHREQSCNDRVIEPLIDSLYFFGEICSHFGGSQKHDHFIEKR